MSGQNMKMVLGYKQFLSTWPNPNKRKVLGNVLLYSGSLQHKAIYTTLLPAAITIPETISDLIFSGNYVSQ